MKSEKIFFRALDYDDLEILNQIRNDDDAYMHTGGNKFYVSKAYDKKWLEDKMLNNQNQMYIAICLCENNQFIGYLGINDIDYRNRKAQWAGINIHKKYWGKGYATDATKLLLKLVFEELGMNKFYGYWLESNNASIKVAEKNGFSKEGYIKDFVFKKNSFHNAYFLSVMSVDYEKTKM